jgi:hypothetical protein
MSNNKEDIKVQFEENKKFRQVAPTSEKQLKYFSNTNNSTTLTPTGDAKSSTEFKFCSLVL